MCNAALVRRYGSHHLHGFRLGVLYGWADTLDFAIGGALMERFRVEGGNDWKKIAATFEAKSQEDAMRKFKEAYGDDLGITSCEWVGQ